MGANVDLQASDARVLVATVLALMRFLTGVCEHVAFQVALRDEALLAAAESARKWPFPSLRYILCLTWIRM